jgi:hypothetical protein
MPTNVDMPMKERKITLLQIDKERSSINNRRIFVLKPTGT